MLIALGHYSLALNILPFFFAGLVLIVLGTGLLKPNISSMVGQLYAPGDQRRDAGFSIFYMGINTRRAHRAHHLQLPRREGRVALGLRGGRRSA